MYTRQLGNSDMQITPLGIGAWAMGGGGWAFAWGPQDDNESIATIHKALDEGINWIDTAPVYGLGHSEMVVGKALEGRSERPLIFTKCGRIWNEQRQILKSLEPDSIRQECENSLRNLKVDVIDLYQMHWPEPDEDIEKGWETMARLQEDGKVRHIGLSNYSASQMDRVQKIAPITSMQPPYSIVQREVEEEVLPYALEHGIGSIIYAPMKSGLLTGAMTRERLANLPDDDWRRRSPFFQEPALTKSLGLVDLLRQIGDGHGRTPGEVAIAWTLRHPAVTAAIVGLRKPSQVDGVIGAMEFRLSDDEIQQIDSFMKTS